MTEEQLSILQHALGLDKYGQGTPSRNHFCAGAADEPDCRALVEMGYMYVFHPYASPLPYYNCAVTDAGREAVRRESPPAPKLSRSQRRYRNWKRVADLISFAEYLRRGCA